MDYVTIYAYPKVWKLENRIYSIMNFKLPAPAEPKNLVYDLVLLLLIVLLGRTVPAINAVPWPLRLIVLPFGLGRFLARKKLDGKMPQRYAVGLARYGMQFGSIFERFESHSKKQPVVKLDWCCRRCAERRM